VHDTIVCTLVLNVCRRTSRARVLRQIQALLADNGRAYLALACNAPPTGKLGVNHCAQNYILLSLPVVHVDEDVAIYEVRKDSKVEDRTRDFVSRRDARKDR
jgi:hypothetical protein